MKLTWGDVLCAAMDACCSVGQDEPVNEARLLKDIKTITQLTGGKNAAYKPHVRVALEAR